MGTYTFHGQCGMFCCLGAYFAMELRPYNESGNSCLFLFFPAYQSSSRLFVLRGSGLSSSRPRRSPHGQETWRKTAQLKGREPVYTDGIQGGPREGGHPVRKLSLGCGTSLSLRHGRLRCNQSALTQKHNISEDVILVIRVQDMLLHLVLLPRPGIHGLQCRFLQICSSAPPRLELQCAPSM